MPDGSPGPPRPSPISTSHITTIVDTSTSSSSSLRGFPLVPRNVRRKTSADDSMKAKIFGAGASVPAATSTSAAAARPRTGHQSVRGRISGPIPIPNQLEDDEFPIRHPGTSIASSTPIESDLRLPQTVPPSIPSPVALSFVAPPPPPPPISQTLPEGALMEMADVPQIPQSGGGAEHALPGTPPRRPSGSATGQSAPGPSPESGASNVSGARSSARFHRANNPSSSARYSTLTSSAPSEAAASTGSPDGPPQRKRSTLRSAIGRLLRRKKNNHSSLSSVSESARQVSVSRQQQEEQQRQLQQQQQQQQQQHRSVPPATRAVPDQDPQQGKRVASMPISEFDRALRSHSIGPDDITAIESARNSIDALGSPTLRMKAAAALQQRIIIPRSRGEDWAGLSPRPASSHARGTRTRTRTRTDDDPNAIGRAITSDADGDITYKRRSRSLPQLDQVLPDGGRRRSDEIRFWRQSYDIPAGAISPLSSANGFEPVSMDTGGDGGRPAASIAGSAADNDPKTPPQPFVFGSTGAMNEMAGMKITQAATLDERFGYLESRMTKLERIVGQLCHLVPGFRGPSEDSPAPSQSQSQGGGGRRRAGSTASAKAGVPTHFVAVSQPRFAYSTAIPPMIPAIYQAGSPVDRHVSSSRHATSRRSLETTTDDNASSRMSLADGHHYMDSLNPPSSTATHGAVSTVATSVPLIPGVLRPASDLTVRPATSLPSLGSPSSQNGEKPSSNSAALIAQLESERAARQLLEDQVRKLSERMNNLSTTMFAMVRDPAAKSTSQERLRPDTSASSPSASSVTALAPSFVTLNQSRQAIAPSSKAQSIFGKESAGLGLASVAGSPTMEVNEDALSATFQTPKEMATPGLVGAFGDEFGTSAGKVDDVDADEEEMRIAARTLSLSQLTMGRPMPERYPTRI
ncbi:unnamed protein product [Discula destructiva]